MFAGKFFKTRPAVSAGRDLYAAAVSQARSPGFYSQLGAADTSMGRFELYTLHVVLLTRRLKGKGEQARETSQALFNAYVDDLDIALREIGVGDLSMGKKMKKLGQAFYGRMSAFEAAMDGDSDLEALISRTVFEERGDGDAAAMAAYVRAADAELGAQADEALLGGVVKWPEAPQ